MKKTLYAFLIVLVVAIVAAVAFWAVSYGELVQVQLAAVQMSELRSAVTTNGKVEAERIYELRAPFAGFCRNVEVKAGDSLKAGQPIVTIEDAALQSELAAARAELEAAKAEVQNIRRGPAPEELNQVDAEITRFRLDLENAKKILETNEWLLKRDAISKHEVEQSRREVEKLQQQLDAAALRRRDMLSRFTDGDRQRAAARLDAAQSKVQFLEGHVAHSIIRAPINGTIYHTELRVGTYVNNGEVLGLFADLSHLRVRAYVDEPELGRVAVGNEVSVQWDAHPRETWKGEVRLVPSEVITHGSRSVAEVLCHIDSPGRELIPNVNVDVEIVANDGPKVLTLPRNTIFISGNDHYVWMIRDGQAIRRTIDTGRGTSSQVEVLRGLSVGDHVIIPGEIPLTEGLKVRVAEQ